MEQTFNVSYPAESVGSVMSTRVPTCKPSDTFEEILKHLSVASWDSIRNVFVVDNKNVLLGYIDMAKIIQSDHSAKASELMQPSDIFLHPRDDQEKAVFLAVKDDGTTIPVVDEDKKFLGSMTAHKIIDIMHQEHLEDALLTAGIDLTASNALKLATERTILVVTSRAPWLSLGLIIGLCLGIISSFFEQSLERNVALAYFIPVVAYIADSVGTQAEAIAVRSLATIKINYWGYLFKEFTVGTILGLTMGAIGGIGAILISQSTQIGLVVFLSLFVASTIACILASSLPIIFKLLGKDPALGSGPLATALQDVLSVTIYFVFAVLIVH